MTIEKTYTDARAHFAELLDRAGDDRETIIIRRRNHSDVALIAADELRGLEEIAHLFRSPANARRLLEAMQRSASDVLEPTSMEELRALAGLADEPVAPSR